MIENERVGEIECENECSRFLEFRSYVRCIRERCDIWEQTEVCSNLHKLYTYVGNTNCWK